MYINIYIYVYIPYACVYAIPTIYIYIYTYYVTCIYRKLNVYKKKNEMKYDIRIRKARAFVVVYLQSTATTRWSWDTTISWPTA